MRLGLAARGGHEGAAGGGQDRACTKDEQPVAGTVVVGAATRVRGRRDTRGRGGRGRDGGCRRGRRNHRGRGRRRNRRRSGGGGRRGRGRGSGGSGSGRRRGRVRDALLREVIDAVD